VKQNKGAFVKVPQWWIREAAKAIGTMHAPAMLVTIELLYAHWKTGSTTVPLSNGRLTKLGISRETKRRALRRLEKAGLITVERHSGRSPRVTLTLL
jgi:hypothetical protein